MTRWKEPGPILSKADFVVEYTAGLSGAAVKCYMVPGTSNEFGGACIGAMRQLNETVREILALTRKKLVVTHRPDDIGRGSRERDEGDFYKRAPAEVEGFYTDDGGLFVAAEESWDRKSDRYLPMNDPHYVVPHEAFHAFDAATGFSDSLEFMAAHRLDAMMGGRLHDYGYQLQPGKRGREETLAEVGCELTAGGCRAGNMEFDFPYSFSLTKEFIAALERGFDWERDWDRETGSIKPHFISACAQEAEKATLVDLMRAPEMYDLTSRMGYDDLDDDARRHDHLRSDTQREKYRIFRNIIRRQGKETMLEAFVAYKYRGREFDDMRFEL